MRWLSCLLAWPSANPELPNAFCTRTVWFTSAIRDAGYDDGQIIEIVQHVALNIWTNYLNELAQTEIDFPAVNAGELAA